VGPSVREGWKAAMVVWLPCEATLSAQARTQARMVWLGGPARRDSAQLQIYFSFFFFILFLFQFFHSNLNPTKFKFEN
jgi:hypothetical protein